uniref:T9SS type B sorting domain-containing protein n=1 Tax=uncultured Lacinutrix sp. TaxID=574032 RepID=UPI0026283BE8
VSIVTTSGTAGTSDYTETTTTVVIPAGATSVDVIIPITIDTEVEGDEVFTVDGTVTSGNTTNTDPSGTVTITDCLSDLTADCDGDGVSNGDELTPPDGEDPTDPTDSCEFNTDDITITPSTTWLEADCDGDGVTNGDELTPPGGEEATDPNDSCMFIADDISVTPTIDWLAADCDGDGVTNGDEVNDGTDPLSNCSFIADSVTLPQSTEWFNGDCDEDNIINGIEFPFGDTDGDGIPNWLDVDDDNDGIDTINEDYADVDVSDGEVDPTGNDDPTDNDTDGDGTPDYLDDDDDNDGILTIHENGDSNGDGIGFGGDAFDSDGDGLPDYLEFDNGTLAGDDLEVFQAVTPNGDNDNDVFIIKNIELFPENTVEIYNRWGVIVYETEGYGQNGKYFKGESNGRVTIKQGEQLPVGTYFYIVKYKKGDEAKSKAGYLYIQR